MKCLFKYLFCVLLLLGIIAPIGNVVADQRISMNLMENATFLPVSPGVMVDNPRTLNIVGDQISTEQLVADIEADYGIDIHPNNRNFSFVVIGEIMEQNTGNSLGMLIGFPEFKDPGPVWDDPDCNVPPGSQPAYCANQIPTFTGNVHDLFIFNGDREVLTFSQGEDSLEVRGRKVPFVDPIDSSVVYTHVSSFYSDVLGGTKSFKNATGHLRLNGNLDMRDFFTTGTGILNCIFILDID